MHATDYQVVQTTINGTPVTVTTYRISDLVHCHIATVDPGATIARAKGTTQEEAIKIATDKANERIHP